MTTIGDILNDLKIGINNIVVFGPNEQQSLKELIEEAQDSINDLLDRLKGGD